jgi:hypothetical protein
MYGDKKLGMQLIIWKYCLCIELEIICLFAAKATIIQSSDCQTKQNQCKTNIIISRHLIILDTRTRQSQSQ